jgi:hypothetical protein
LNAQGCYLLLPIFISVWLGCTLTQDAAALLLMVVEGGDTGGKSVAGAPQLSLQD